MSSILVIYRSQYGSTKQYAQWLATSLQANLLEAAAVQPKDLTNHQIILFGGGLYAGKINGLRLITENMIRLQGKAVIVFAVGISDPSVPGRSQQLLEKNFSPAQQGQIRFFQLRGDLDYTKLKALHRLMMAMLKRQTAKKPLSQQTLEDRQLLATYRQAVRWIDQRTLEPILSYVKGLELQKQQ